MTSAGGLVSLGQFSGKDSLLSGPAGGVIGCAKAAQAASFGHAIGFDMGGTSTDVARFDQSVGGNGFQFQYESIKAGIRVSTPQLAIETVAAGGGSICEFDGTRFRVGPKSASSEPGPACYGRGGPLAVTDVNFFLGFVSADHFPWKLDRDAVEVSLRQIQDQVKASTGKLLSLVEIATGFRRIANLAMANAIRSISVVQGYDPREHVLVAFGGAAPQHACAVADELGIKQILIHPFAAILSAHGIGVAEQAIHRTKGIYQQLDEISEAELDKYFCELEADAGQTLKHSSSREANITSLRRLELRYIGTDQSLVLSWTSNNSELSSRFQSEYRRRFGYVQDRKLEVVSLKLEARQIESSDQQYWPTERSRRVTANFTSKVILKGKEVCVPLVRRADLNVGDFLDGPCLVVDQDSTIVIEHDWMVTMRPDQQLLIERVSPTTESSELPLQSLSDLKQPDPVLLEVFNSYFEQIATEMGETLRQTSVSVNVKERLDYSCALFTDRGNLVVNAPHIPVHLGAMSHTVRAVHAKFPEIQPGDAVLTNNPFSGGSHLPDVTLVSPVFDEEKQLLFWVASRAHHAELGGIRAGSMPPESTHLGEEGVLIDNFKILSEGESYFAELQILLETAPYPSRNVAENLADIKAQLAANRKGELALGKLFKRYGVETVCNYMDWIQYAAEEKVRTKLRQHPDGSKTYVDYLDDGSKLIVCVTIEDDGIKFDFTGSNSTHPGNLNANPSIVTAAVIYAIRCFVGEDIPLNEGLLGPVELVIPEGILSPAPGASANTSPAVVGGNVETSQRIVDILLGALGLAAASQGTMNNLLFGNDNFGYYETICGGSGATESASGAHAVHSHMTNTRLTDPEILESHYPVRLRSFHIRPQSGGQGLKRGGNGAVREIEFLEELEVSLLTQRRGRYRPFGLCGGEAGQLGKNLLIRDGQQTELPSIGGFTARAGDLLRIETPGGGGWGALHNKD